MTQGDHHSHFDLHTLLHSEFTSFYIFHALRSFVNSMIGLFIPVYLYSLGYFIWQILLFSILVSSTVLLCIPLAVWLLKKRGFRLTLVFSTVLYFLLILLLNNCDLGAEYVLASGVVLGAYMGFFWPSYHSELALRGSDAHRGSQIGMLHILTVVFTLFAPLLAGFLLENYDYLILLLLAVSLLVLGLFPLFLSKDILLGHYSFSYFDYLRLYRSSSFASEKIAFLSQGIETSSLTLVIWPLILFILLSGNFLDFGFLLTVVGILNVLFLLYFKSKVDGKSKGALLSLSAKLRSLNWFFRAFVSFFAVFFLFAFESISRLLQGSLEITFMSIFYNNAHKQGYMDYVLCRELFIHLAKICFFAVLIPFLIVFGESLVVLSYVVLVGIAAALGLSMLQEKQLS